jgi:hypothetical protein
MVRAKFYVAEKTEYAGDGFQKQIVMRPVTSGSDENKEFFRWTPSGELKMTIKSEVADQFPVGSEIYVDFSPAVVEEVTA